MTGFLASVSSMHEAELVRSLGADVIDLKNPDRGALGAVDLDTAQSIAAMIGNGATLSATIGDLPLYAADLETAVGRMHATGVDIIKVGVFDKTISRFVLNTLNVLARENIRIVLVFFAEIFPDDPDFQRLKKNRDHGSDAGYLREGRRKLAGKTGRWDIGGIREQRETGRINFRPGRVSHQGRHPAPAAAQPGLPGLPGRIVQTKST